MEKELQKLECIEKVDAPPFLFTRIQEKIKGQLAERVSTRQAVFYLTGIALVILVNVFILRASKPGEAGKTLGTELRISTSNQFYE